MRGFWLNPKHVSGQFQYLTNCEPLDQKIEENLRNFLSKPFMTIYYSVANVFCEGHLEVYILDADSSMETRKALRDMELVCEVDMQGSQTLKDLHLIVRLMKIFSIFKY